jgi:hypothetical protein
LGWNVDWNVDAIVDISLIRWSCVVVDEGMIELAETDGWDDPFLNLDEMECIDIRGIVVVEQ